MQDWKQPGWAGCGIEGPPYVSEALAGPRAGLMGNSSKPSLSPTPQEGLSPDPSPAPSPPTATATATAPATAPQQPPGE